MLLPQPVGALRHVGRALRFPLLVAVVVGERRAIEGVLEIGLRVGAAEEVLAGPDLAHRIERLAVRRQIDAREQRVHHAGLVRVHHELLVAHGETALEPACGVQHEIDAGEQVGSKVFADSKAAWASGIFEAQRLPPERNGMPRRRASAAMRVEHQRGLRRAEGRRARLHRDRGGEAAEDHRCAGIDELHEGQTRQCFGECLRHGARDGHRATWRRRG